MKHLKKYENFEDDDEIKPIGMSTDSPEGINGLEFIFSPLESDMVEDWNNNTKIQKFIKEERLFLQQDGYDKWSIWGVEGDNQVKKICNEKFFMVIKKEV